MLQKYLQVIAGKKLSASADIINYKFGHNQQGLYLIKNTEETICTDNFFFKNHDYQQILNIFNYG